MIPKSNKRLTDVLIGDDLEIIEEPSYTYKKDIDSKHIKGHIDNLGAIEQRIYKILSTERYKYIIYDHNFGIELKDLYGQPTPYVYSELKRRIEDSLLEDDRITQVYDFTFENVDKDSVHAVFKVKTNVGNLDINKSFEGLGGA